MRRLAVLGAIVAALLPAGGQALAAAPQTNLADVEDEVMCPICGTLLELSSSPQAEQQRAYVLRLIAAGQTKDEIKDALVAQYGQRVLAVPPGSGFDLSAYLVPAIAFAIAVLTLAIGIGRWRRASGRASGGARRDPAADPVASDEDSQRLEADLARYDL
jgi:cytochrome c-type biogenesis protein CcmH